MCRSGMYMLIDAFNRLEALQEQRRQERSIRATRQQVKLMEAGGADSEELILKRAKYQGQMQGYKAFSDRMGLPMQYGRIRQDGLSGQFSTKTGIANSQNGGKLTDKELGALLAYKSFDEFSINAGLRDFVGTTGLDRRQREIVSELDSALKKLPKYEGDMLFRVVDFSIYQDEEERIEKFLLDYEPGKDVFSRQYWSTSEKEGYNEAAKIRIYIENPKNGRYLKAVKGLDDGSLDESEVLYERNCKFTVIEKSKEDDIWRILVAEKE